MYVEIGTSGRDLRGVVAPARFKLYDIQDSGLATTITQTAAYLF